LYFSNLNKLENTFNISTLLIINNEEECVLEIILQRI